MLTVPQYYDLTTDKRGPPGNAWGVFGQQDDLGTLNHIDDQVVKHAARSEIQTGHRISLSLPMDFLHRCAPGRTPFSKVTISRAPRTVNDDEWHFNSQASSQWDGFRHYGVNGMYYMGRTSDDFEQSTDTSSIHHFKNRLVGRGVLVDWYSWSRQNGSITQFHVPNNPSHVYSISVSDMIAVLDWQGTVVKNGDILILRTGWLTQYRAMTLEALDEYHKRKDRQCTIGAEFSEDLMRWLWASRIACVASDNKSFEAWTPDEPGMRFHERALAGWGMPIGELFDLDDLSQHCRKIARYTFFFCSIVVDVRGAVASPANTIAIF